MARFSNQKKELTPKQTRAITALLSAKDVQSAAKEAGVGERTLHAWLTDPAFKDALKAAEATAIEDAVRRLAGAAQYAVIVVQMIMADKANTASVRLRAASVLLEQTMKLRQFADLEQRLSDLEQKYQAQQARGTQNRDR